MIFAEKYLPRTFSDFGDEKQELMSIISSLIKDVVNILLVGNECSGKSCILDAIIAHLSLPVLRLKDYGVQYCRNDLKFFCQNRELKVVIVDDIDMFSESSQQILRNCIDKFSDKTYFVMSCSNPQKVLQSIQTLLFTLKIPDVSQSLKRSLLDQISEISLEEDVKEFIIETSQNIKCMLYNLQKCFFAGKTQLSDIKSLICTIHPLEFDEFTNALKNHLRQDATERILKLYNEGFSVIDILDAYYVYVKQCRNISEEDKYKIITVIAKFTALFYSIHEDSIELSLFVNDLVKTFS
jgi:DNA polymerase III delta prime subunit